MNNTKNLYMVYRHWRLDTFKPFYVGKTKSISRVRKGEKRSEFWEKLINNTQCASEVVASNLSETDAYELEEFLIQLYGRIDNNTGILSNKTNGGVGAKGVINTRIRKHEDTLIKEIIHLNKIGYSITALSKKFKLSEYTIKNIFIRAGIEPISYKRLPLDYEGFKVLYEQGLKNIEIRKLMNYSRSTIDNLVKRYKQEVNKTL